MAKLYNGINGPVSGRVGDLVFSSRNGINYVRKVSNSARKKPSAKQVIQRERFAIVMRFLSPLRGILTESYRKANPKASGLHRAAKQIVASAITGEYPDLRIDYSKASLISGSLFRPCLEMVYIEDSNDLLLSWHYIMSAQAFTNDELVALIYCPSFPQTWHQIQTDIMRSEQGGVIKLPRQVQGHEIHIWLTYRSEMMDSYSDSVYMGQIFTHKPDDHG